MILVQWKQDGKKINGNWYFMKESGAMVSNTTIDGYYLGTDGVWAENTSGN
jgi:glucan-binding YG repeat protein